MARQVPDEVMLGRLRRETAAREAELAALRDRLLELEKGFDQKLNGLAARLTSQVNGATATSEASITQLRKVIAQPDLAMAEQILNLQARIVTGEETSSAFIEEFKRVTVTADSALAQLGADLSAKIGANTASISTIQSTYATQAYAESKKFEAISASNGHADAIVSSESSARAGADDNLSGQYVLKVNAGTHVIQGISITSQSGPAGDVGDFVIDAGTFKIKTDSGANTPFTVTGNVVKMTNAVVASELDIGTSDARAHITPTEFSYGSRFKLWARGSGVAYMAFNPSEPAGKQIAIFGNATNSRILLGPDAHFIDSPNGYLQSDGTAQLSWLQVDDTVISGSFNTFSARRFKDNIAPIIGPLDLVSRLRGVTFDWKTKPLRHDIGFIAEEVAEVIPAIVGSDDEGRVTGLDYGRVSAVLVEAVKELNTRLHALELQGRRS